MDARDDQPARTRRRFLVRRVTLEPHGDREVPIAVCPRRLSVLSVEQCGACVDFVELCVNRDRGTPFMRCSFDEAVLVGSEVVAAGASGDQATCVADVMRAPASCALTATLADVLDAMTETEVTAVVDSRGRAVGLLNKADILQHLYDRGRTETASTTVGEMRLSPTFLVSPDAPIGQVAAILAYERLYAVLVVDSEQALIGIVSALDLARWLACRSGYVVPAGREP
jgi:CBS domain-containing protein